MECSKVVIIGPYGCGKSTFTKISTGADFDRRHLRTLGADVSPAVINIDGYRHLVNIWDRAGHPQFMGLGDEYNVDMNGIFVCIDLSASTLVMPAVPTLHTVLQHTLLQHTPLQHTLLQHTPLQHTLLQHTPLQHTSPQPRVVYLGLKADIANQSTVAALAARRIPYISVSSKLGIGIKNAWVAMLE